ncbi:MAG: hypothetical protein GY776_00345 [Alteromonas sp.]|nr:hypothetical protein [Alteromonas sp.]
MATWGQSATASTGNTEEGRVYGLGGAWTATGQKLDSIHFYNSTVNNGLKCRFAVYSGGDSSTPDWDGGGAPVLVGQTDEITLDGTAEWKTYPITGTPNIPDSDDLWILLANDDGQGNLRYVGPTTSHGTEDFDTRLYVNSNNDSSIPLTDPSDINLTISQTQGMALYITHSDAGAITTQTGAIDVILTVSAVQTVIITEAAAVSSGGHMKLSRGMILAAVWT